MAAVPAGHPTAAAPASQPTTVDRDRYSFTADAPWRVDPAQLPWTIGGEALRRRTRALVPRLLAPRRLPPARRVAGTSVALAAAVLPWYVGARRRGPADESRADLSRRLRRAFARLGPTYIKLGQIVSSGEGLFPAELVDEFRQLRDRVPAEPFDVVRATVEEELGAPLQELFATFDTVAIAAASIAQVHAATLPDGTPVVVKVQRRTVSELVRRDLAAMSWFAPHLVGRIPIAALANPPALVELFAETIVEELDFRLEAQNMLDIGEVLARTGQRTIVVPRPHPTLVTRRVLVMERLHGFPWDDAAAMRAAGIDTEAVVRAGMIAFLEGAMLHGVFHGDLHGGNLFVRTDGTTALLDHGITGRLDPPRRQAFLRLMMSGTTSDVHGQVRALCDLGALPADTDIDAVVRDLGLGGPAKDPTTMTPEELIGEVRELTKALLAYGARLPKELMLYVKDLLFLDASLAVLAPDLDLFGTLTGIAMHFAAQHGAQLAADLGHAFDPATVDLTSIKSSMGIDADVQEITYADLRKRRALIAKRMQGHERAARAAVRDAAARGASARRGRA